MDIKTCVLIHDALEREFNIDIDDEANSIETVGDAVNYISGKVS